ncbi:MAG: hypothetical protein HFH93_04565 [Lachnospiraceae bacterium]|mgnify:CR=1 FL=1|nr:hypothetical protein [Lachnospiraceae bacterium]
MKLGNAAKAILFCVIAVLLYRHLYKVLSWKDTGGDYRSAMDTFYSLEENVVDVAFLGSSHCYSSIITAELWEQYGMAAYNLSISGQDMASSYYCMKELLKTQKPAVICLEMYYSSLEGYQVKGNLYRNLLGYRFSDNFAKAVDSIAEDAEKRDILLKWPIIHTRYAELTERDFRPEPEMRLYMGWEQGFSWMDGLGELPVYAGEESWRIPEETEQWLTEIIALAREADVELCFFLAPFWADEWTQMQYRYAEGIADANGVPFLNMIALQEELQLDTARDFSDTGHTNSYGAQKVTKYMGEYLTSHYGLKDRRGESQYRLWDENLAMWKRQLQNQELKETVDLKLYLDRISRLDGYTAILVTRGQYLAGDVESLSENLANLGIGEAFFRTEGAWVLESGTLRYEGARESCFYHMGINHSDIVIREDGEQIHVIIDRQEYKRADQGIDIVLYDQVLGKVVDTVGFGAAGDNYTCVR